MLQRQLIKSSVTTGNYDKENIIKLTSQVRG